MDNIQLTDHSKESYTNIFYYYRDLIITAFQIDFF